jgi:phosphonate transport system substrate-binding protein
VPEHDPHEVSSSVHRVLPQRVAGGVAVGGPVGSGVRGESGASRGAALRTAHLSLRNLIGDPDLEIERWPEDAEGLAISFTDPGSTSGWLIPHQWFSERDIDPRSHFSYSEGATHAANVSAVANGTMDLATDFDRNLRAMIDEGVVEDGDVQIVWTSEPLPNDAIAVRNGFPREQADQIEDVLANMSPEQAADVLPEHYTGFVTAAGDTYQPILDAALAMDVLDG